MINQNILTLILITFFCSLNAQVYVFDSYSNSPVSNVKIFSKEGRILATSNINGEINISEVAFSKNDSIEIYHSNYISQRMIWTEFREMSKIYLNPDSVTNLREVILTTKKSEYLLLKGYFMTYQIIDDVPVSFSDGIVEYYINLNKGKVADTRILESRTFKNKDSITAFGNRKGNSTFNVLSTISPFRFEEEVLLNEWDKYSIDSLGNIKSKNEIIGRTSNNNGSSEFAIEYYTPQNTKRISLMGITSVIKNKTIFERFNSRLPMIENITSLGKYYNSDITKKEVTINYELIQDFYSIENKYLSKENFKNYQSRKGENEKPNPYLGNKEVSVIPEFIELMLYKDLELITNSK